jgi:hypothetical protein
MKHMTFSLLLLIFSVLVIRPYYLLFSFLCSSLSFFSFLHAYLLLFASLLSMLSILFLCLQLFSYIFGLQLLLGSILMILCSYSVVYLFLMGDFTIIINYYSAYIIRANYFTFKLCFFMFLQTFPYLAFLFLFHNLNSVFIIVVIVS